ncbi:XRE family transcriptional regulator [Dysgonomonas capnocytophagoides]|uniref:XRE family transcriptional regulator n=1 Tax=Dysgonomonas capnocytophagoides TaxID=45254 RepID=A0A4Y8KVE1_9BACT|nr:helix-turn-helix transcriptional regulator [Dysgonomonas capnocytophagoides]TFD92795.1 XRE family transcriptional regulator [Dysgonomonas capnocytophagoides]
MRKVNAFIERGNDGTYGVYIDLEENKLTYGVIGEGKTAKESIDDFYNSYAEMRELYKDENKDFEEVEFVLKYDLPSFLQYYSKILSLAGIERLTGVNQTQLSHYISGFRKPSKRTSEKIETALHNLGKELSQIEFV